MFTNIKASLKDGTLKATFGLSSGTLPSKVLADVTYGSSHTLVGLEVGQKSFSMAAPESEDDYTLVLKALVDGAWVSSEEVPFN